VSTWQHWIVGQVDASIAAAAIVGLVMAMRHRVSPSVRSILLLIALIRLVLPPWMRSPWSEALVDVTAIDDVRFVTAEMMRSGVATWMFATWSAVSMWLFVRLLHRLKTTRRYWVERTVEAPPEMIPSWCHVEVRLSPSGEGPMALGIRRPLIVVPDSIVHLDAAAIDAVLAHEVAHHERRDLVWLAAAHALSALVWFNPLAHVLVAAVRSTREDGCDDWAVARTSRDPYAYAQALLQSARLVATRPPATAMAAHPMSSRLRRLLDGTARRDARIGWAGIALILMVGTLAIPGAHMPDADDDPGNERIVVVIRR
jgi:beta-lactamase regulating signal transducer with metallopeptidase domain